MISLTEAQYASAAQFLGVDMATVKAVAKVESANSGFLSDGRPVILFEGHIFYRELRKFGMNPDSYTKKYPNIVYPKWTKSHYKGGAREYDRLDAARAIHETAALKSASWGAFQVMGFNHGICGWGTVQEFVDAMYASSENHLKAFLGYCATQNLVRHLQKRDWRAFARGYNGSGQVDYYAGKLQQAYYSYTK